MDERKEGHGKGRKEGRRRRRQEQACCLRRGRKEEKDILNRLENGQEGGREAKTPSQDRDRRRRKTSQFSLLFSLSSLIIGKRLLIDGAQLTLRLLHSPPSHGRRRKRHQSNLIMRHHLLSLIIPISIIIYINFIFSSLVEVSGGGGNPGWNWAGSNKERLAAGLLGQGLEASRW